MERMGYYYIGLAGGIFLFFPGGGLAFIVFGLIPGTEGENNYGPEGS